MTKAPIPVRAKPDQSECKHKNTSIVVPAANKVVCNDCGLMWKVEGQRAPIVKPTKPNERVNRGAVLDKAIRVAPPRKGPQ